MSDERPHLQLLALDQLLDRLPNLRGKVIEWAAAEGLRAYFDEAEVEKLVEKDKAEAKRRPVGFDT